MTRLASLVVSFSVLGMASCAWSADGLPSRSDCLVRVDFPKGFQNDQEAAKASPDRLQPYRDRVGQHERNIQAINRELSSLK